MLKPFFQNEVPLTASEERAIAHQSFKLSYIILTLRNVLIFKQFYFWGQHLFSLLIMGKSEFICDLKSLFVDLLVVSFSTD